MSIIILWAIEQATTAILEHSNAQTQCVLLILRYDGGYHDRGEDYGRRRDEHFDRRDEYRREDR